MGKYRKILAAIDGSESSVHALRESFKLAANEKSWITAVCVIPPYEGDLALVGVGNVLQAMRQPCENAIKEARILAKSTRVLMKAVLEEGMPHEKIIDVAEAENCELIVMGRKGISKLERALLGSVTARVIGYSQMDVLVVPFFYSVNFKNILLATDGSKYSKAATEKAIDFAASYGGALKILSIVDVPAEFYGDAPDAVENMVGKARAFVDDAKKKAADAGIQSEGMVVEGEAYLVINDIAKKVNADLIVMGSHGRTGMKRLLMGSVAEKVIGYAPCPVLVARA